MRAGGTTFIYVSHFLADVLRIADDVTVLKDGRRTSTGPAAERTPETLVEAMLGRKLSTMFPSRRASARSGVALEVRGLSSGSEIEDVTFSMAPGEIVGVAGIVGSGRSELAHTILGARPFSTGRLTLNGEDYAPGSPRHAWRRGVRLLPESRRDQGLFMGHSVTWNVLLPHLAKFTRGAYLGPRVGEKTVRELLDRMDYRGDGTAIEVGALSGGNQQKTLFARCLLDDPAVLVVDEPTRGVDVGARHAIYGLINDAADRGVAVLVISSELEEVIGLADRILAMRRGRIVAEFDRGCSESAVLNAMLGTTREAQPAPAYQLTNPNPSGA
jgi:simple sugar transport system ATP-binding protein/ribose transport system ATP-binding protein